ncbi:MAG: TRAP transporter small permease subunit [Emcibacter sp.]|nr:TRAP transporter small permease subunit [Emcibacter sp.]
MKIRIFLISMSKRLNHLCEIGAIFFLVLMLVMVSLQVVARYGFNMPPEWTEEGARYCMIWMGLLGATVSYYRKEDPIIFSPSKEFMAKWNILIRIIEFMAVSAFVIPLVYFGPSFIERQSGRLTETLGVDTGHIVAIIPIFAAVVFFHGMVRLIAMEKEEPHQTIEEF